MLCEKVVLKNLAIFTGKYLCQSVSFFIEKETVSQASSCEFCKILKNTYIFKEHLKKTASEVELLGE